MASVSPYAFTQGVTPTEWANIKTLGPSGSPLNCYPSPTRTVDITYTFVATASGCPVGYKFQSNQQTTTSSTCIFTGALATPVTYTWDCAFTVSDSGTTTVNGGTSTIGATNARTVTAAPTTITVTQTQSGITTATSVYDPGAQTVSVTSTVTQGAAARKRTDPLEAAEQKCQAIANWQTPLEYDRSNASSPLLERACSGYQCQSLCCLGGQTCVGDGHYCCTGYKCVPFSPADPFTSYSASWLTFTAKIRTSSVVSYKTVTTFATTSVTGATVTQTPTSTVQVTVKNVQTVSTVVTQTSATVTVTVFTTLATGSSPAGTGPVPTSTSTSTSTSPSISISISTSISTSTSTSLAISSSPTNTGSGQGGQDGGGAVPTTLVVTTPGATVTATTITTAPAPVFTSPVITTAPPTSVLHAPVARWSGSGNLLNGYCTTPDYVLMDGATAYWVPFVGCDNNKPDCCPYGVTTSTAAAPAMPNYPSPESITLGTLVQCPDDYQTVSSGCCPSGYLLWNSDLGGQTPCYSTLASYLTPPPIPVTVAASTTAASSKQTQAIVNVVYAMYYPVQSPPPPALSTGAKAGIGAGAGVAGVALIIAVLAFFLRRMSQSKKDRDSALEPSVVNSPHLGMQPTIPVMSQYGPPKVYDGTDRYNGYSAPVHQGIEPYNGPDRSPQSRTSSMPPGGSPPQEQADYEPRPAYQSWPGPGQERQPWLTQQQHRQSYPSPPTSTGSPPPGSTGHASTSFSSHGSYTGQPQQLQVVHDGFSRQGSYVALQPPHELQVVHEQERQEMSGQEPGQEHGYGQGPQPGYGHGQDYAENYERRPELGGGSAHHFPGNHELAG